MKNHYQRVLLTTLLFIVIGVQLVSANDNTLRIVRIAEARYQQIVLDNVEAKAKKQNLKISAEHDMVTSLVPRGATLVSVPERSGSYLLYLSQKAQGIDSRLASGLYEIEIVQGLPILYYYDPMVGKIPPVFTAMSDHTVMFHTPLGDDLCRNAPDLIYDFCQTFVACAAYELFC